MTKDCGACKQKGHRRLLRVIGGGKTELEHRVRQKERKIAKFWELVLKYTFAKEVKALTQTQMDETGTSWGNKGRIFGCMNLLFSSGSHSNPSVSAFIAHDVIWIVEWAVEKIGLDPTGGVFFAKRLTGKRIGV